MRVSAKSRGKSGERDIDGDTHLHPPFFSIVEWHLSHSFVLALIQLDVSLSSAHFFHQSLAIRQMTGRWSAGFPHLDGGTSQQRKDILKSLARSDAPEAERLPAFARDGRDNGIEDLGCGLLAFDSEDA